MTYPKKISFYAALLLCTAVIGTAAADASADFIMFRRKPSADRKQVRPAVVPETEEARKPVTEAAAEPERGKKPKEEEKTASETKTEVKAASETKAETAKSADVSVEKAAPAVAVAGKDSGEGSEKKEKKAKKAPQRDAVITADRTDYDRKEGVVLFDRNVYVDDAQYQMHTDRLFLFLDGTNDLKRLVAIGNVAITNENRRAYCARATFNKKLGRIVMYSSDEITAELREEGKKGSEVKGEKITFWIDSEQVEVENPVITMPGGFGGKDSLKKALGR